MIPTYTAKEAVEKYNGVGDFTCSNFYYSYGDSPNTVSAVSSRGDVFTCCAINPHEWVADRIVTR
jgi:hypothetical protein